MKQSRFNVGQTVYYGDDVYYVYEIRGTRVQLLPDDAIDYMEDKYDLSKLIDVAEDRLSGKRPKTTEEDQ